MNENVFESVPVIMADLLGENFKTIGCVIGRTRKALDHYFSVRKCSRFSQYEIVDISFTKYKKIFEKSDYVELPTGMKSEATDRYLNEKKYIYRVKSVNDIKFTISDVSEEKAGLRALEHVRDNLLYFINLERVEV